MIKSPLTLMLLVDHHIFLSSSMLQNLLHTCTALNFVIACVERFPQQKNIDMSSSIKVEVAISGSKS